VTAPARVASTDGVRLAVHDLGGAGPTLLVCHATGFHGRAYAPLAAELTSSFHVVAVDFRGHGHSTLPDHGDLAWRGMGDDVLAVVDALGEPSVVAFGHSMGGAAILLAELSRPGTIRAAYLYEPIVTSDAWKAARGTENPMSDMARRRREVFASRAEALYRYASRPPLNVMRADALAAYVEHGFLDLPDGTVRLACRAETEARTFDADDKVSVDLVAAVTSPITVGVGDRDDAGPVDLAAPTADALAHGRLVHYPLLGHFGPFEDSARIAADIVAALSLPGEPSPVRPGPHPTPPHPARPGGTFSPPAARRPRPGW
jgi:pimeloyl-ACP methyl ester carboxylesterase